MSDYFRRQLDRYEILTREEERELFAAWKAGDKKARERIILGALRYAYKTALARSRNRPWAFDDLLGVAYVAVVEAFEVYDVKRGKRFVYFAEYFISKHVARYLHASHHAVYAGINHNMLRASLWIRSERQRRHGEHIQADEVVERCGVSLETAHALLVAVGKTVSMSQPLPIPSDDGPLTLEDLLADDCERVDDLAARAEARSAGKMLTVSLSAKERDVVESRYLVDEPETLSSVGRRHGLTRERVRQIESAAFAKMRERVGTYEKLGL